MNATINTLTGPLAVDELGTTLIHEHVMIGYPGWEADSLRSGPSRDEGILDRGSYLGFDRFGIEPLQPDEARVAALLALL